MHLRRFSSEGPLRTGTFFAGAAFVLGIGIGAIIGPALSGRPVLANPVPLATAPAPEVTPGLPADVLRVVDGDTFEAKVHVWPGMDITTKVRLRGIDAPEMRARCADERSKAEAARDALGAMLGEGGVMVLRVGIDKYGGRVLATAATRRTADVSAALLARGLVRAYAGGRRESWCEGI
jgi:endonuclease YncB( thermonuclease family)